jgi:hypothetical protein
MEEVAMTTWNVTVQEFTNVVVQAMYEIGYFKEGQNYHPEDIASTFSTVATGVAMGMAFSARKMMQ